MVMAFNYLPYTSLILIPVFYSPHQAFNSSTKGLRREEGQNNRRVGTKHKPQKNGKREKVWTNEQKHERWTKDEKIRGKRKM
jgi:hypothetical protein